MLERQSFHIQAGGHRLAVERLRDAAGGPGPAGPTLVFLHEGLGSIAQWHDFPAALSSRTGLEGVVYDRLGYGASDPLTQPRRPPYLHDEALTTLPEVLDRLEIEAAILIGHSDGGSIALIAAAAYPDRVRGVITEAAHVFVEEVTLAGIREALHLFETSRVRERLALYHGDKTVGLFHAWADTWLDPAFRHWNIEDCLPSIICPVLAIQGQGDAYGTAAQVEAIVGQVSGKASSLIIADCGHIPHREAPAQVLEAMARFLEGEMIS